TAGLTDVDVGPVGVANLADGGLALLTDEADLAGGQTHLSHAVLLSHQLSGHASGTNQLSALAGIQLDAVDHFTHGDVGDGQAVAGQDVGVGAGHDDVAGLDAHGSQDITALAVLILDEGDVGGAVGVVLQVDDGSAAHLITLEVDDTVLALVAAAAVADGDAAVAVTAGVLLEHLGEGALRLGLLINALEGGHSHVTAGGRCGLVYANSHSSISSSYTIPSKNSMVLDSSVRVTTAFFQLARRPWG